MLQDCECLVILNPMYPVDPKPLFVAAAATHCIAGRPLHLKCNPFTVLQFCLKHKVTSLPDDLSGLLQHSSEVDGMQELGQRCMSAEAVERPKFDEVLHLVDELDVDT